MQKTEIPWTDFSWNPACGCPEPISEGCAACWARKLHNQRHKAYLAGKKLPVQYAKPFEEIQLFTDRLNEPLHKKKPCKIAVCLMGDLFAYPFEFIDRVALIMSMAEQHTYQILTKRAERALAVHKRWLNKNDTNNLFRSNVHLGVSVENQKRADERIPILLQIPGIKFLSLEPLLGPMDIRLIEGYTIKTVRVEDGKTPCYRNLDTAGHLNHIIIGAESIGGAAGRECKLEWIESLVEQAKAAGVPCGVKQIHVGGKLLKYNKKTGWPDAWPEHLKIWEI